LNRHIGIIVAIARTSYGVNVGVDCGLILEKNCGDLSWAGAQTMPSNFIATLRWKPLPH